MSRLFCRHLFKDRIIQKPSPAKNKNRIPRHAAKGCGLFSSHRNQKPSSFDEGFIGAATRIRTGDLILTKDVLYQLSHSSMSLSATHIV